MKRWHFALANCSFKCCAHVQSPNHYDSYGSTGRSNTQSSNSPGQLPPGTPLSVVLSNWPEPVRLWYVSITIALHLCIAHATTTTCRPQALPASYSARQSKCGGLHSSTHVCTRPTTLRCLVCMLCGLSLLSWLYRCDASCVTARCASLSYYNHTWHGLKASSRPWQPSGSGCCAVSNAVLLSYAGLGRPP